jgi:predicted nucleic acid-binding protein
MILADTSVWLGHLRVADVALQVHLLHRQILIHSFVLGEIACGNLHSRFKILSDLSELQSAVEAENTEVMALIAEHRLFGTGIGWVDAHLIASALLTPCRLWTFDLRLNEIAKRLGVGYSRVM